MSFTADKDVNVASVNGKVNLAAAKEIILECGGAFINMKDGSITLGGPFDLFFKTITVQKKGKASMNTPMPDLPKEKIHSAQFVVRDRSGTPIPNYPYRLEAANGLTWYGVTDEHGNTERVWTASPQKVALHPHHVMDATDGDDDHDDSCDVAPNKGD
ncbi:hypothetical protein LMG27952_07160 [Paraburkholderia hiiakae]|uniref:DUF2345 domain-containing protein n=2 Tax=Paraburkholderia hiiakae TaxID=1081782 RepID=A0ABN7IEK9_9BURK|nr:hypothetical protein LMG27952_07160 [Paraburkholderia hiiakae]